MFRPAYLRRLPTLKASTRLISTSLKSNQPLATNNPPAPLSKADVPQTMQQLGSLPGGAPVTGPGVHNLSTLSPTPFGGDIAPADERSSDAHEARLLPENHPPMYLSSMKTSDVVALMLTSAATSHPTLIKLCTKLMPYTPNALIKAIVYSLYCGGANHAEVVETGKKLLDRGFGNMMLSYSVEDAEGGDGANALMDSAVDSIIESIDNVLVKYAAESEKKTGKAITGFVALKPTGLMKNATAILRNHDKPEYAEQWAKYLDVCRKICRHAAENGEGKVGIVFDAEKKVLQPGVYAAQRAMMQEFNVNGAVPVIGTIQMYLQDSIIQLQDDISHAAANGYQIGMKLVRGAYIHSEPDRWTTIHRTKEDSDISYNRGVALCLDGIIPDIQSGTHHSAVGKLIVASHNECSMALAAHRLSADLTPEQLESQDKVIFAQLMGMAEDLGEELAHRGYKVLKYVPWGPVNETKDYLVRRMEENGDTLSDGGMTVAFQCASELAKRLVK
ncbi:Proline dehydrogenase [Yarrowia sp. C11]|nr:Proline dehydrogenase [Yarrowia sp. C11]